MQKLSTRSGKQNAPSVVLFSFVGHDASSMQTAQDHDGTAARPKDLSEEGDGGSMCSASTASADAHDAHDADETLIVLDWDDTLLPTSWLRVHGTAVPPLPPSEDGTTTPLSRRVLRRLADLDAAVVALLDALQCVGTLVIITNAAETYVELTAAAFLPGVARWLAAREVGIMSARSWYEAAFPTDVAAWKVHAFADVVQAWRVSHGGAPPAHVISVGDSVYERAAAHALAQRAIRAVKTIKLKESPTCRDMEAQVMFLAKHAGRVALLTGDVDVAVILPPGKGSSKGSSKGGSDKEQESAGAGAREAGTVPAGEELAFTASVACAI